MTRWVYSQVLWSYHMAKGVCLQSLCRYNMARWVFPRVSVLVGWQDVFFCRVCVLTGWQGGCIPRIVVPGLWLYHMASLCSYNVARWVFPRIFVLMRWQDVFFPQGLCSCRMTKWVCSQSLCPYKTARCISPPGFVFFMGCQGVFIPRLCVLTRCQHEFCPVDSSF